MTRAPDAVTLPVIGRARTPWTRREDAPHQPSAAPDAVGAIEIRAEPYRAALADLDSFSASGCCSPSTAARAGRRW
ncbi:MAG: hypothetical protein U0802_04360 [Candidatus Binatia bacterium]